MYYNYYFIENFQTDNEIYELAVKYMALTELYDRSLTNLRSPYDSTSAFILTPFLRSLSNSYAIQLKNKILNDYGYNIWAEINNEIHKHIEYNAQIWIDEYYRLNEKKGCLDE